MVKVEAPDNVQAIIGYKVRPSELPRHRGYEQAASAHRKVHINAQHTASWGLSPKEAGRGHSKMTSLQNVITMGASTSSIPSPRGGEGGGKTWRGNGDRGSDRSTTVVTIDGEV